VYNNAVKYHLVKILAEIHDIFVCRKKSCGMWAGPRLENISLPEEWNKELTAEIKLGYVVVFLRLPRP
jgi:hypothetical protein